MIIAHVAKNTGVHFNTYCQVGIFRN